MKDELVSYVWLTQDVCFTRGPLALYGIIITSSTTGRTEVTLRDGNSPDASIICTLRVTGEDSEQFNFFSPVRIIDGVWCEIDDYTTGVMLVYKVLKE